MKHHQYQNVVQFSVEPVNFNRLSEKSLLQYCLGATLYMPGNMRIVHKILQKELPGVAALALCFEDAIAEGDLPDAENNVIQTLTSLSKAMNAGKLSLDDVPLIFVRVRNTEQFKVFSQKLTDDLVKTLTGFVLPKFTTKNGDEYLSHLKALNHKFETALYGMPTLESREIAYKETRISELVGIRNLLRVYQESILNIRVGGTDFSSIFGVRRGIDQTIYNILTVSDCLSDILNIFNRDDEGYVLSAPVWEYYQTNKQATPETRQHQVNKALDGLLHEVTLDIANGFIGKTVIHPSQVKVVNAMHAVTREAYDDAVQILDTPGGVIKSLSENKMNEINPHTSWAKRVLFRSRVYGVIEHEES